MPQSLPDTTLSRLCRWLVYKSADERLQHETLFTSNFAMFAFGTVCMDYKNTVARQCWVLAPWYQAAFTVGNVSVDHFPVQASVVSINRHSTSSAVAPHQRTKQVIVSLYVALDHMTYALSANALQLEKSGQYNKHSHQFAPSLPSTKGRAEPIASAGASETARGTTATAL